MVSQPSIASLILSWRRWNSVRMKRFCRKQLQLGTRATVRVWKLSNRNDVTCAKWFRSKVRPNSTHGCIFSRLATTSHHIVVINGCFLETLKTLPSVGDLCLWNDLPHELFFEKGGYSCKLDLLVLTSLIQACTPDHWPLEHRSHWLTACSWPSQIDTHSNLCS